MVTCASHLEVGEKRLWCGVGLKRISVSDFLHPRILDNGKDELQCLLPRRLVGAAVGAICLVHRFRARAEDRRDIVIDRHVVGANACGFRELRAIARCVRCHRPNEADEVAGSSRFVIQDLEEERRHDLPYSSEVGV